MENPNEIKQTMPVRPNKTAAATAARLRKAEERKQATKTAATVDVSRIAGSTGTASALPAHYTDEALAREDSGQPEAVLEILKDDWGNELDYAAQRAENPFDVAVKPWIARFPDMAFYWFHPSVVEKVGMGPYKKAPDVDGLSNTVADSFLGYCPKRVAKALKDADEAANMRALASTRRDPTMPGAELTGFDENGRPRADRGVTFRRGADGAAEQIV